MDTLAEMAEAVADISRMNPAACRRHVVARFAPKIMTDAYVKLYETLLDRQPRPASRALAPAVANTNGRASAGAPAVNVS